MSGFTTTGIDNLTRTSLWSSMIKEPLLDELHGLKYVDWLTEFTDGDTLNIPSIGQMEVYNYDEDQAVRYTAMDTGNFQFSITDYIASGTYVTKKMLQDSWYMNRVQSTFVPKMQRAIAKQMEVDLLAIGPENQTATDSNTINGAKHRFVGSGTSETMTVEDFKKAKFALQMANVPMSNLIAIVDPTVEMSLALQPNLVNFSNNPRWEGIVSSDISTGMKFIVNIYGFDVYTSHNLKVNTTSEAIDGVTAAAGVNNLFFSAASGVLPFVGSVRQAPEVESKYNQDRQRWEYVTTCRYGFDLFRPENLVVVLTDQDQVYA